MAKNPRSVLPSTKSSVLCRFVLDRDYGSLAQLVEHRTFNAMVARSNRARPTISASAQTFICIDLVDEQVPSPIDNGKNQKPEEGQIPKRMVNPIDQKIELTVRHILAKSTCYLQRHDDAGMNTDTHGNITFMQAYHR